ncbi:Sin3 associated polypeptide p18-domain-containing protein [Tuber borchii]|uniref:Sin3 associated polypeptide p18-domain-containing protein n=1 Tax=Tuber borchii TaxID=42251 RepID=A0A2T6ZYY9_TUBBO|nr:Sin3 associated polypeptide p18-domain-containing protein [Tuber borchii]
MSAAPPLTTAPTTAPVKVDRRRTTPFLLKLFYRQGGFHRLDDFHAHSQPREHVTIYTWRDCTLNELSMLLSQALPGVCPPRSRCGFRLIFADTRYNTTRYTSKDLGAVVPNGDAGLETVGRKTLSEVSFVVGDWIDVCIYPEGHGGVGATGNGRGGFGGGRGGVLGGPRENGFGGFRVRGGARGAAMGGVSVPSGEWRRGERVEDNVPLQEGGGSGSGGGGGGRRDTVAVGRGGGGYGRRGGGGGRDRRYRD